MQALSRYARVLAFAAIALAIGMLLGLADWPQPNRAVEFCALTLLAVLTAALAVDRSPTLGRVAMSPSFVIEFASLLLFGAGAAVVIAASGIFTRWLVDSRHSDPRRRLLLHAASSMVALQAAGLAYQVLGGTIGGFFTWPWQGVPIAAAVGGYWFVKSGLAEVVVPLFMKHPIDRSLWNTVLRTCPLYFIGASLAVGLVEVIDHRIWELLPVAAIPMYLAHRTYVDYLRRVADEYRRRQVIEALDEGMSVVDTNGQVTLWDEVLERIIGCLEKPGIGPFTPERGTRF